MQRKLRFKVEGLMCEGCVSTLRKALSQEARIDEIDISLERHELEVSTQAPSITPAIIVEIIEDAGYAASHLS